MIDTAVFNSAHLLPLHWAALALMCLGLILILAEAALPSFGAIGATGIIAFTVGGMLLMDANIPGLSITPSFLFFSALTGALIVIGLVVLAVRSQKKSVITGKEALIGEKGPVLSVDPGEIYAQIQGERWRVVSTHPLSLGDQVKVKRVEGLTLHVELLSSTAQ